MDHCTCNDAVPLVHSYDGAEPTASSVASANLLRLAQLVPGACKSAYTLCARRARLVPQMCITSLQKCELSQALAWSAHPCMRACIDLSECVFVSQAAHAQAHNDAATP